MDTDRWRNRLEELIVRHGTPGASLAIWSRGRLLEVAAGFANIAAGIEATPEAVFQIGSITKVYTATVAMQLVEEGLLDIDAPIVDCLPEFRVADPDVTGRVTMRHLLAHTSGLGGDLFLDTGRGDDAVARFVAECADLRQIHPLGAMASYCNSGYIIAGHVIERVTGLIWDDVITVRIVRPLGLTHTVTLAEDAVRFRAATGHLGPDNTATPYWMLPRSGGPAGLVCARSADVVAFARMHIDGGIAQNGARLLSPETVKEMATAQDPPPVPGRWQPGRPVERRGLGWVLYEWDGARVIGHDGGTIGQSAFLRIIRDCDVVVVLLANGGNVLGLYQDVFSEALEEAAGLAMPPAPVPPERVPARDLTWYAGRFERVGRRIDIAVGERELVATMTDTGPLAGALGDPVRRVTLVPVDGDGSFLARTTDHEWIPATFFTAEGVQYLEVDGRCAPRVGEDSDA